MTKTHFTRTEAKKEIERIAQEFPGGKKTDDGLGFRRDGVPGTGGGTIAISYVRETKNYNKRNYVQVGYC